MKKNNVNSFAFLFVLLFSSISLLMSQSLDLPSSKWGRSFGNSKDFTGLRFNYRDHQVNSIAGINFTLWNS